MNDSEPYIDRSKILNIASEEFGEDKIIAEIDSQIILDKFTEFICNSRKSERERIIDSIVFYERLMENLPYSEIRMELLQKGIEIKEGTLRQRFNRCFRDFKNVMQKWGIR